MTALFRSPSAGRRWWWSCPAGLGSTPCARRATKV